MPRSSRHKSSKNSSREARDYSDSEKDSGLKDKKGRDDGGSNSSNRYLKESTSGEKRKLETKSVDNTKESIDEYGPSSSRKRKDKVDDDRWTGGVNNEHELSGSEMKERKCSSDSKKSSRRGENLMSGFDVEEGKIESKIESKHHRSERKERSDREGGERKGSKSERLVDGVLGNDNVGSEGNKKQGGSGEERRGKHGIGNTEFNIQDEFRSPESERDLDRRVRRKKDGSGYGDKHHDDVRELDDRRLSSRDDAAKSGRYKDDGHKDERTRDKYKEDVDKDILQLDDKQRDTRPSRDYTSGKSDYKQVRNEKKDLDILEKKSKLHQSEYDRDRVRERDRDRDHGHDRDRDQDQDRGHARDRDRDHDRGRHDHDREHDKEHDDRDNDTDRKRDRDLERGDDRDRELDRDRERGRNRYRRERDRDTISDRDHNHDRGRGREYDHDHGYGSRYKEDRGRRRSPDIYDEYRGDKARRLESEADKERSLSCKAHLDSITSSSRRRASPSSRSYAVTDKYRDGIQDEIKHVDSLRDGTSVSEAANKVHKYRSAEKHTKFDDNHSIKKFDDNHISELPGRSPSTKASPAVLKERSPSSTSVDHRFRSGRRRSLDVDEAERRSSGSNDVRDIPLNEDRQGRDFSLKKPMGEDYPRPESSFYRKSSQGNVSSHGPGPGPSGFRAGADGPSFIGSLGEESRGHSGSHYRRSVDPNVGRGPGHAWKGVPNWPSPLPNGFMPFPPGPPGPHHGGFPPMLSQFPPLFGVRPSLEMSHPGIPYHMGDADRFPGHLRPMGWPNMVDGSVPPHFQGWDANNGILRDESSSMYGPGHLSSARGRDLNADKWKSNDVNMDVTPGSQKDATVVKTSIDEASSAQGASRPHHENSCPDDQGTSFKNNASSGPSSKKDIPMTPTKASTEKTPESFSVDDSVNYLPIYLTKLDISMDLADPELYNQCINIGVKGHAEYVEEDVELDYMEEKAVGEPEITNLTMDLTIFPAAKDSIFQRAMDLYKGQNAETTPAISNGEKLHSPPVEPSQLEEVEVGSIPNEPAVGSVSAKEEDPTPVVAEMVPITVEEEGNDSVPITGCSHEKPSAEPSLDVEVERETPVLGVENEGETISKELIPQNVESTDPNPGTDIDGKNTNDELDVGVSGPLILSHDSSVKVCEALMPLSNESESAILSRIHHHAPESTR